MREPSVILLKHAQSCPLGRRINISVITCNNKEILVINSLALSFPLDNLIIKSSQRIFVCFIYIWTHKAKSKQIKKSFQLFSLLPPLISHPHHNFFDANLVCAVWKLDTGGKSTLNINFITFEHWRENLVTRDDLILDPFSAWW